MRIKNANLKWNVIIHDFSNNKIEYYDIMSGSFAEDLAKIIKKKKITTKESLKSQLKLEFMYRYWCKCEFEVIIGGLFSKTIDELDKIDVWYQIEPNLDTIVDYLNYKMDLKLK